MTLAIYISNVNEFFSVVLFNSGKLWCNKKKHIEGYCGQVDFNLDINSHEAMVKYIRYFSSEMGVSNGQLQLQSNCCDENHDFS